MPIDRIATLRDCGVFRDFKWPADLPGFARYNLIYGWNGTGKTTLSRLFRDLGARTSPAAGQATFIVSGKDFPGERFAEAVLPVRVFNRDFVMDSVFPVGGGDVPPIYVVGKESVEKQKEADRLKARRAETQSTLQSARSAKEDAERAFDRFCIDRAKVIKDTLRSSGPNPYNNYDKSDFETRAQRMAVDGDARTHRLIDSDRQKWLVQLRATPKPTLSTLMYQQPALRPLSDAVSDLLRTTVVSAAIQSLKDDPTLSAWVRQGLALHQERQAAKCLYCEQAMPADRLSALVAHFNAEYEQLIAGLEEKISEIRAASTTASDLAWPNRAQLFDDLAAEYEIAEALLRKALAETKQYLDALVEVLSNKRGRAFEAVALDVTVPETDSGVVDRVNEIIRKHNEACDDFRSRLDTARTRTEVGAVADDLDEFVRLRNAVQKSEATIDEAAAEIERFTREISRLEREIVEHRKPADELNDDLQKYLGHNELRLDVKDTGYSITRNGVPAPSLSEGETTAIALLYFLKSLDDRRFELANGVVVLDDPVSSLDANALYLAFGYIRERTEGAVQLFIFTHNFTFFRQVRNWFHHLPGQKKQAVDKRPARFYMVDCVRDNNERCARIRGLDPLLERYESEYHYLFARIVQGAAVSTLPVLEDNYILPNVARRLLEAFLAFRQPHVSGELWQKLKDMEFDEAKKLRILRFLHTGSHGDAIGEAEHDSSVLGEAGSVLKDLLEFIREQDRGHYAAMVKIIDSRSEEEGDA